MFHGFGIYNQIYNVDTYLSTYPQEDYQAVHFAALLSGGC